MSIKLADDSFVETKEPVMVPNGDGELQLFVRELGFMEIQSLYASASMKGENALARIVEQSVSDEAGNRFTYEEVMRLKQSVMEPLFKKVTEINHLNGGEKN